MSLQRWGIVSMRMRLAGELGDDPSALGHRGIRTASLLTRFQGQTGQAVRLSSDTAAHRARADSLAPNWVCELETWELAGS
jgi:hypothetical protein